jgi:5-methylcytosine-specific restriction endonuclease McrA
MDKPCKACGVPKPESDFYFDKKRKIRYAVCKACHYARNRAWKAANIERYRELGRKGQKRHAKKHPDKVRERMAAWVKAHPDCWVIKSSKRRAQKLDQHFSMVEWAALKLQYGNMCLWCERQEPAIRLVPDHVVPLARGGSNTIDNIQPLCQQCNGVKHAKTIDFRPGAP